MRRKYIKRVVNGRTVGAAYVKSEADRRKILSQDPTLVAIQKWEYDMIKKQLKLAEMGPGEVYR